MTKFGWVLGAAISLLASSVAAQEGDRVIARGSAFDLSSLAELQAASKEEAEASEPVVASHLSKHPDEWKFTLAPYLWLSSISTEIYAGPVSTDSDVCFTDLLQKMEMGAQLRFEGLRGRWGFYVDGTYIKLGGESTARVGRFRIRGVDIDVDFTQAWLDFGGLYRLGEQGRSFDLMAGGRFAHLGAEISVGGLLDIDPNFDSVAPVFGARWQHALSECWVVTIWGDVSGFGVGDAADLALGVTGVLGYRLSEKATLHVGYRFYDIEYDKDELDAEIQFHGPVVGVAFHF